MTETKPTVVALLRQVRRWEHEWVAGLTDAERAATGTAEHHLLAPKHLLSHITAAKRRQEERLAVVARGEEPPSDHHTPEQVFAAHQHDPWPQVEAEAEEVSAALVARVEALDERDLSDPNRFAWAGGKALVAPVLINGVWHPFGHIVDCYRARGDQARVAALHAAMGRAIAGMDEWAALRADAVALYNLACFNALGGATGKALTLIGEAVRMEPELIGSAREDHDLDALRGEPVFQALLADQPAL